MISLTRKLATRRRFDPRHARPRFRAGIEADQDRISDRRNQRPAVLCAWLRPVQGQRPRREESQVSGRPAMLPALAAGEVDLAWMGEFPAVTGYSPTACRSRSCSWSGSTRQMCGSPPIPPPGIAEPADLKGKRVGVAIGSTSHYHLLRALSQANLKASDLTLVNLTPANMPPAYIAGQIDAAFVWEPNVGVIERAGAKPIATTKSLGMITGGVWVTRKAFIDGSPETVAAVPQGVGSGAEGLQGQTRRSAPVRGQADRHGAGTIRHAHRRPDRRSSDLRAEHHRRFPRRARPGS